MKPKAVDFIAYTVNDMDRAEAFYRDTLGLNVLTPRGEPGTRSSGFMEVEAGGTAIGLTAMPPLPNAAVALAVDDVHAAIEELRGKGVEIAMEPVETEDCFIAAISDPDGNQITSSTSARTALPASGQMTPDEALQALLDGNQRYVANQPRHPHQRATHRRHAYREQAAGAPYRALPVARCCPVAFGGLDRVLRIQIGIGGRDLRGRKGPAPVENLRADELVVGRAARGVEEGLKISTVRVMGARLDTGRATASARRCLGGHGCSLMLVRTPPIDEADASPRIWNCARPAP
jgi:predicted enzyme related to lactoylglutathione lyase